MLQREGRSGHVDERPFFKAEEVPSLARRDYAWVRIVHPQAYRPFERERLRSWARRDGNLEELPVLLRLNLCERKSQESLVGDQTRLTLNGRAGRSLDLVKGSTTRRVCFAP